MEEYKYNLLPSLKRGDKVIVTTRDKDPEECIIKSIGSKYVTINDNPHLYFYNDSYYQQDKYRMRGGYKDGSYISFTLWKVSSLEEYENLRKDLEFKNKTNHSIRETLITFCEDINNEDYQVIQNILSKYEND